MSKKSGESLTKPSWLEGNASQSLPDDHVGVTPAGPVPPSLDSSLLPPAEPDGEDTSSTLSTPSQTILPHAATLVATVPAVADSVAQAPAVFRAMREGKAMPKIEVDELGFPTRYPPSKIGWMNHANLNAPLYPWPTPSPIPFGVVDLGIMLEPLSEAEELAFVSALAEASLFPYRSFAGRENLFHIPMMKVDLYSIHGTVIDGEDGKPNLTVRSMEDMIEMHLRLAKAYNREDAMLSAAQSMNVELASPADNCSKEQNEPHQPKLPKRKPGRPRVLYSDSKPELLHEAGLLDKADQEREIDPPREVRDRLCGTGAKPKYGDFALTNAERQRLYRMRKEQRVIRQMSKNERIAYIKNRIKILQDQIDVYNVVLEDLK